jgi:hypothetical protein
MWRMLLAQRAGRLCCPTSCSIQHMAKKPAPNKDTPIKVTTAMKRTGAEVIEGAPEIYAEELAYPHLPGHGCRQKALIQAAKASANDKAGLAAHADHAWCGLHIATLSIPPLSLGGRNTRFWASRIYRNQKSNGAQVCLLKSRNLRASVAFIVPVCTEYSIRCRRKERTG